MTSTPEQPLVTVGALIERPDGKCLFVRTHKWHDTFGVPGGKVARGETLEAALCREILEETALVARDVEFLLIQESIDSPAFYKPVHMLLLNYHCHVDGSDVRLNEEAEAFLWATPEAARALELSPPTRTLVEYWLEHAERRSLRQA